MMKSSVTTSQSKAMPKTVCLPEMPFWINGDPRLTRCVPRQTREVREDPPAYPDTTIKAETVETTGTWLVNEIQGRAINELNTLVENSDTLADYKALLPYDTGSSIEQLLRCTTGSARLSATRLAPFSKTMHLDADNCTLAELWITGNITHTREAEVSKYLTTINTDFNFENLAISNLNEPAGNYLIEGSAGSVSDMTHRRPWFSNTTIEEHAWFADSLESSGPNLTTTIKNSNYQLYSKDKYTKAPTDERSSLINKHSTGELHISVSGEMVAAFSLEIRAQMFARKETRTFPDMTTVLTELAQYRGNLLITAGDGSSVDVTRLSNGSHLYSINEITGNSVTGLSLRIVPESSFAGRL